jgi:NDP-sugar pyrophosphorylase family protein
LAYLLDHLARADIPEVVLLTGYQARQVQRTFGNCYGGMRLVYSMETAPLGTAGALRLALPKLTAPVVLLMNGDSFCEVDLVAFWHFHQRLAADLSLVLTKVADTSRFGRVRTTAAGRVQSFDEKTPAAATGWINAGVYFLRRRLIEEIPSGYPVSLERDMMPTWINARRRVFGFPCPGRFLDIGTPQAYAEAATFFLS